MFPPSTFDKLSIFSATQQIRSQRAIKSTKPEIVYVCRLLVCACGMRTCACVCVFSNHKFSVQWSSFPVGNVQYQLTSLSDNTVEIFWEQVCTWWVKFKIETGKKSIKNKGETSTGWQIQFRFMMPSKKFILENPRFACLETEATLHHCN